MPRDPPVTSATRPLSENRSLNMRSSIALPPVLGGGAERVKEGKRTCSPDGAKRNPGKSLPACEMVPDFAALHPGYGATEEPYAASMRRKPFHTAVAAPDV